MNAKEQPRVSNGWALLPFILFIVVFLGSGVILSFLGVNKPFNQFPALVAAYIAAITAIALCKGTFQERLNMFLQGMGRPAIAMVVTIFMLAGAFAGVAEAMGGVDSVVNLCLTVVPHNFIVTGIFLIASIIAFASGSSMGTIVTIAPIALGIVETSGVSLPVAIGAVCSGGVFGNQLSPISDCTIAITTGMGVSTKDKTKYNVAIALPALIIASILFMFGATGEVNAAMEVGAYSIVKIIPYVVVLGMAIFGVNVVICLSIGILLCGAIGIGSGALTPLSFVTNISDGAISMGSVIVLILVVSGVAYMVDQMGGINFIIDKLTNVAKTSRSAHLSIAALTALTFFCVANDTVTTIITAPFAKDICKKFRIDPRAAAVTVTVVAAGFPPLIPWSGFTFTVQGLVNQAGHAISIVDTFGVTYYPILLILFAVIAAALPGLSAKIFKQKWDFENDCVSGEGTKN